MRLFLVHFLCTLEHNRCALLSFWYYIFLHKLLYKKLLLLFLLLQFAI